MTKNNKTADTKTTTTLVVGATGATGKHVVRQLLEQGHVVKVIVRSKARMLELLTSSTAEENNDKNCDMSKLQVTEASFLDYGDQELQGLVAGCDAAVCCLGHNMTFQGLYGKPRRLVKDSVHRLRTTIETSNPSCKLIVMGTDGASHPMDDPRSMAERIVLFLLRYLLPPHADNEAVVEYLLHHDNDKQSSKKNAVEWAVVRPTDLKNGSVSKYKIYSKPPGGLFGDGICTRANVAAFMVQLILDSTAWEQYKFQMPVIHDEEIENKKEK